MIGACAKTGLRGIAVCTFLLMAVAPPASARCGRDITAVFPHDQSSKALANMAELDRVVADRAGRMAGCTIHSVQLPLPRAKAGFLDGRFDIIWSLESRELGQAGTFVGNQPAGQWVLVTTRAPGDVPVHLADFLKTPKLLVGGLRGGIFSNEVRADIDRLVAAQQWDEAVDYDAAVRKVIGGRDAAALILSYSFQELMAREPTLPLRAIEQEQYPRLRGGAYVSQLTLSGQEQKILAAAMDQAIRWQVAHPSAQ